MSSVSRWRGRPAEIREAITRPHPRQLHPPPPQKCITTWRSLARSTGSATQPEESPASVFEKCSRSPFVKAVSRSRKTRHCETFPALGSRGGKVRTGTGLALVSFTDALLLQVDGEVETKEGHLPLLFAMSHATEERGQHVSKRLSETERPFGPSARKRRGGLTRRERASKRPVQVLAGKGGRAHEREREKERRFFPVLFLRCSFFFCSLSL